MNKHIEKAMELRENPNIHYNCAQAILCAYEDEIGISFDKAFDLGFNFGSGMKNGGVCGTITAGLMVLGFLGINDPNVLNEFRNKMASKHDGMLNCTDLLRANAAKGGVKKVHCDGMITEAIETLDEIIAKEKAAY